jgi:hypothetical protein
MSVEKGKIEGFWPNEALPQTGHAIDGCSNFSAPLA